MDIVLIQARMQRRPMDSDLKARMSPSLALLTLANLTPKEHRITIINENVQNINFNIRADLVALTVTVDVFDRSVAIAKCFRSRGIPVVAGGIHITAAPETAVAHFDAVCIGMAERVWPKMIADTQRGTLQEIYCDMDDIPAIAAPAYTIAAKSKYLYTNIVTTSRHCNFQCDFCYNSCANMPHRHITRPIADVVKDIQTLNTKHILFVDDNFIGNPAYTQQLLYALRPLGITWNAAVSANIVDHPKLLDQMQRSGCKSLFVGFESVNPAALAQMHKRQNNVDKYEALVAALHSRAIMINASIVFGLPGDTPDTFDATLAWMISHKIETVTAHILTPYPGTILYRRMRDANQIVDFDLSHYNTAHVVLRHDTLTAEELYGGYLRFYQQFYSVRSILRRLPDSKVQRLPFLLFNFCYRKYGKLTAFVSRFVPLHAIGRLAARVAYPETARRTVLSENRIRQQAVASKTIDP